MELWRFIRFRLLPTDFCAGATADGCTFAIKPRQENYEWMEQGQKQKKSKQDQGKLGE